MIDQPGLHQELQVTPQVFPFEIRGEHLVHQLVDVTPEVLQEMLRFVVDPDGKEQAQEGGHDDTVIALALALHGCQQIPAENLLFDPASPVYAAYASQRGKGSMLESSMGIEEEVE